MIAKTSPISKDLGKLLMDLCEITNVHGRNLKIPFNVRVRDDMFVQKSFCNSQVRPHTFPERNKRRSKIRVS